MSSTVIWVGVWRPRYSSSFFRDITPSLWALLSSPEIKNFGLINPTHLPFTFLWLHIIIRTSVTTWAAAPRLGHPEDQICLHRPHWQSTRRNWMLQRKMDTERIGIWNLPRCLLYLEEKPQKLSGHDHDGGSGTLFPQFKHCLTQHSWGVFWYWLRGYSPCLTFPRTPFSLEHSL